MPPCTFAVAVAPVVQVAWVLTEMLTVGEPAWGMLTEVEPEQPVLTSMTVTECEPTLKLVAACVVCPLSQR